MTNIEPQIHIVCRCGNEYSFVGKDFEIDIQGPLILTCKKCGNVIDVFKIGKSAINP